MAANIVTLEDLNAFGEDLLQKIHSAFSQKQTVQRKWLKSHEVLSLLRISPDMITHIITNLSATEIEAFYGNRTRSRMREMFNLISFNPSSPDKRK